MRFLGFGAIGLMLLAFLGIEGFFGMLFLGMLFGALICFANGEK